MAYEESKEEEGKVENAERGGMRKDEEGVGKESAKLPPRAAQETRITSGEQREAQCANTTGS